MCVDIFINFTFSVVITLIKNLLVLIFIYYKMSLLFELSESFKSQYLQNCSSPTIPSWLLSTGLLSTSQRNSDIL